MTVAIYKLAREFDWWTWLCPRHAAQWVANGWQIRERKAPPRALPCDDANRGDCEAAP